MDGFKRPSNTFRIPGEQPVQSGASLPPVRPDLTPVVPVEPYPTTIASPQLPTDQEMAIDSEDLPKKPKRRKKVIFLWLLISVALVGAISAGLGWMWYQQAMQPVNPSDGSEQKVQINQGATLGYVAERLEARGIIRSGLAFQLYAYKSGMTGLKQGSCTVTKKQTAQEILGVLYKGCTDFKAITFYPGATIEKPLYKPPHAKLDQTMYVKYVLEKAGYSAQDIEQALNATYSGPLFSGKPAGTSLEGYIFGETYYVDTGATAKEVLQTTFDQMYKVINDEGFASKYTAQGLNLYQAITLASIVQRELNCEDKPAEGGRKERCYQYQRTIAQVFLKRYKEDNFLGSDVTFIYAADMMGVAPTVEIDSPYNTRINRGLPPGPIAAPGLLALRALANPTDTNYEYFLAGDDGLIYFANTEAEHEANIRNHCQILCNEL